jgi:hypothetical protein
MPFFQVFPSAAHMVEGSERTAAAFATATGIESAAFFTDTGTACRFWTGLLVFTLSLCVLPCFISLHALLPLWRSWGLAPTVAAHVGLCFALASRLTSPHAREAVMRALGGDLGFPSAYALVAAAVLTAVAVWLETRQGVLGFFSAASWRGELERGGKGDELITTGAYSLVRHPKYAQTVVRALVFFDDSPPLSHS